VVDGKLRFRMKWKCAIIFFYYYYFFFFFFFVCWSQGFFLSQIIFFLFSFFLEDINLLKFSYKNVF